MWGTVALAAFLFTYALLLNSVLGVKPTMVPFTGGAPVANALVGGQIDYMVNGSNEVDQQVQAGTIKAYAIAAAERHPTLPNVPTTLEAGLPEFLTLPWFALFAPKGVPQPILDQAHRRARPGTRRRQRAQASCRYRRQRSRQGKARSAATRRAGEKRNCPLDADHQGRKHQSRVTFPIFHNCRSAKPLPLGRADEVTA